MTCVVGVLRTPSSATNVPPRLRQHHFSAERGSGADAPVLCPEAKDAFEVGDGQFEALHPPYAWLREGLVLQATEGQR